MSLELSALRTAGSALTNVLNKSDDAPFMGSLDDIARNAIKSGVIKHFEFTYALCWKFMKRWLEMNVTPGVADGVTRRELFRQAAEERLIVDVDRWMRYHDARNGTSLTYNPMVAEEVYRASHDFILDAASFLRDHQGSRTMMRGFRMMQAQDMNAAQRLMKDGRALMEGAAKPTTD